jgi:hypothetical protein
MTKESKTSIFFARYARLSPASGLPVSKQYRMGEIQMTKTGFSVFSFFDFVLKIATFEF